MSDAALSVSADVVTLLRDGLRARIAAAARAVADREGWPERRERERAERDRDDLDRIVALRALLNEIVSPDVSPDVSASAQSEDPCADVCLHLGAEAHGWALRQAVSHQLQSHADMLRDADADADEVRVATLSREISLLQALALEVLLAAAAPPTPPPGEGTWPGSRGPS